jgi:hypothetical protein
LKQKKKKTKRRDEDREDRSMAASMQATDAAGPLLKYKRLANMNFNQHGGRRGTRSATNVAGKMLRKEATRMGSIRPGPMGMGLRNPAGSNQSSMGGGDKNDGKKQFSHLHQLHEKYNEK